MCVSEHEQFFKLQLKFNVHFVHSLQMQEVLHFIIKEKRALREI